MDRVLVIDDDVELCELLLKYLQREGFQTDAVHDGKQGVNRALSDEYDLIILDVMLPELNGFDVLRRIRAKSVLPIIMLTARGDDVDRIVGLEIGADDYLPKPFNPRELVARIRAILRRTKPETKTVVRSVGGVLALADIEVDLGARVVRQNGNPIAVTSVEFDLLEALLFSAGSTVAREALVKSVLGRNFNPLDRSIDVHISNLRKKLGQQADGTERIKTIRGVGYIYTSQSDHRTVSTSGE